jgi:enoyl-CoA hydratase
VILIEREGEVAVLRMDDGKANAMNPDFFAALEKGIDEAAGAGALVLTGARNFFSGGLDLPFLAAQTRDRLEEIYDSLHSAMMRLFLFPTPVVAAINGHAIAGGCILAFQSDSRLMARGSFRIGLNEAQLGLPLPAFVVETFRGRLAPGALERMTLEGPLFSPEEAVEIGLVDEVVPAPELEARAVERAKHLASVPDAAFAESKRLLREEASVRAERGRKEESRRWIDLWFSPQAQRRIGEVVAKLKKK